MVMGNNTFVVGNGNVAAGNNTYVFATDSKVEKGNSLVVANYTIDLGVMNEGRVVGVGVGGRRVFEQFGREEEEVMLGG